MAMTYLYCKAIIDKGDYDKDELLDKLDVFLLNNRITQEQFDELVKFINFTEEDGGLS